MIASLHPLLDHRDVGLGVDRSVLNSIREEFVDKLSVIQRMRREAAAS